MLFLYSKIFDSDLSPLPFNAEQMFHFLAVRFENTGAEVQEQNLSWMQVGIAGVVTITTCTISVSNISN